MYMNQNMTMGGMNMAGLNIMGMAGAGGMFMIRGDPIGLQSRLE